MQILIRLLSLTLTTKGDPQQVVSKTISVLPLHIIMKKSLSFPKILFLDLLNGLL